MWKTYDNTCLFYHFTISHFLQHIIPCLYGLFRLGSISSLYVCTIPMAVNKWNQCHIYAHSWKSLFQQALLLERLLFVKPFPPPPKSFSPLDDYACCHILAAEVIHSGWEKSCLLWWQGKEKFSVSIGIISRSNYTFFYIFTHKSIIYVYFRAVWLVLCNTTFAYQNYIFLSLV